ncbi:MobF family relaxase [Chroococcidiopsis sp. CCMEE 29]|uniref:MobF family relaxase n=1 Tax=Chroococcidiopsis sp. CCMEE 29 TaxID=155894 RepID=UPI0020228481|nr:MobF family relaxase [Chroococcidiopsis sp. CCMEE 29]
MLSINTINSGIQEKEKYYTEDESLETESEQEQSEYYTEAETQSETRKLTQAVWHGKGAENQGLEGNVKKEDFKEVFYGFKPGSQERIRGKKPNPEDQERLAEDLTFSAPKSVSMALHLGDDLRLFDAHTESVKEVLDEVEQRYATTRIQRNGERQVVNTDNLTIALIPHHTSRDGDMQMHTHAVIMNGTQGLDGVWRALHNDAMSLQGWLGNLLD